MKAFSFKQMQVKLKKKKNMSVQEKQIQNNFLQIYDDHPTDPRVQIYCNNIKKNYQQIANNHRYYQVCKEQTQQKLDTKQRLGNIRKLKNYDIAYKDKVEQDKQKQIQLNRNKELIYKLNIRRKFRRNVFIVIQKLKKIKLSVDQVIKLKIFSNQPYRFGKEIFIAVKQGKQQKIWRIIMENKLQIFSLDHTQKNALIWASIRGYHKIVKMLIDAGSDLNKQDINGFTPLYYALKYDHPKCVHILLIQICWIGQQHHDLSMKVSQTNRHVFDVGVRLMGILRRLPFQKRIQFFKEQFNYYYPDQQF